MTETTAKEIEASQRKDVHEIKADAELFANLVKHPGWARYLAMIEKVGQNYHNQVMQPLENVLQATKPEYAKGALMGLSLAAQLPSAKMREAAELKTVTTDDED